MADPEARTSSPLAREGPDPSHGSQIRAGIGRQPFVERLTGNAYSLSQLDIAQGSFLGVKLEPVKQLTLFFIEMTLHACRRKPQLCVAEYEEIQQNSQPLRGIRNLSWDQRPRLLLALSRGHFYSLSPVWRLKLEVDGDRVANPHRWGLKETKLNVTGTEVCGYVVKFGLHPQLAKMRIGTEGRRLRTTTNSETLVSNFCMVSEGY